jgi:hypothetical protein
VRRALLFLLIGAALLAGIPAQAFFQTRDSSYNISIVASGSSYTGLIDIVASPTAFYSLRAGSAAIAAAGTQKLVNIRRASDNVACDFLPNPAGGFGVTTATCNSSTQGGVSYGTFVGTDATGTCTIATTTLTCTGLGSTLHANDLITGTGITNPCILSSPGSLVGGAQTATAQIAGTTTSCGTVSVAETVTAQPAGLVPEKYDQSGDNYHATQGTAGKQPQFLPLGSNGGTLPAMLYTAAASQSLQSGAITSVAQPYSAFFVGIRTGTFTSETSMINTYAPGAIMEYYALANTMTTYAGSFTTQEAVSDSAWHVLQAVFNNTSSIIVVDATHSTGLSAGTNATGTSGFSIGSRNGAGGDYLQGLEEEEAYWPIGATGTQSTNLCNNAVTYWGTGTSC